MHYDPLDVVPQVPPPPAPLVGPGSERPRKKQKGESSSLAPGHRATPTLGTLGYLQNSTHKTIHSEQLDESDAVFYKVAALPAGDTSHGDCRDLLQEALEVVGASLREDPTLPGDPPDATRAIHPMLRELMRMHCAKIRRLTSTLRIAPLQVVHEYSFRGRTFRRTRHLMLTTRNHHRR